MHSQAYRVCLPGQRITQVWGHERTILYFIYILLSFVLGSGGVGGTKKWRQYFSLIPMLLFVPFFFSLLLFRRKINPDYFQVVICQACTNPPFVPFFLRQTQSTGPLILAFGLSEPEKRQERPFFNFRFRSRSRSLVSFCFRVLSMILNL